MGQEAVARDREPSQGNPPVGEILRRARLHYDQSVLDIERALRIKGAQIEAIESGHYEQLPGRVYVIGFIRSYSEYLGLDGEKMVELFKAQSGAQTVRPELHFPVAASETKIPQMWIIGGSLLAALAILVLWWTMTSHDRSAVVNIPSVPETMKAERAPPPPAIAARAEAGLPVPAAMSAEVPATAAAASPVPQPQPAATPLSQAQAGIILKIIQNSWVEIKDSEGKPVVSRVLKAGDKYFVPDRPDLYMSLGNSGGVQVEIGGQDLAPLGERGQVLRNVPLDAAALKKKFAPPVANPAR